MTEPQVSWWLRFPSRALAWVRNSSAQAVQVAGLLVLANLVAIPQALGEGSVDLAPDGQAGKRARMHYVNATPLGMHRRNSINVYAAAGESLLMGHSAFDINATADIVITSPDGTTNTSCKNDLFAAGTYPNDGVAATFGLIDTRGQELAGPDLSPLNGIGAANYNPCAFVVTQTGIHRVWFVASGSAQVGADVDADPADGTQFPDAAGDFTLSAWDVTVVNADVSAVNTGAAQSGRAYFNLFWGSTVQFTNTLNMSVFVHTKDGHTFKFTVNDGEPFGFNFYANNKGVLDVDNVTPTFQSANTSTPNVHQPAAPDDTTNNLVTYKVFFNDLDSSMPASARFSDQNDTTASFGSAFTDSTTWLNTTPSVKQGPTDLKFIGNNNVEGITEVGQGGTFTFTATVTGTTTLTLDLNDNGNFEDAEDVVLLKSTIQGQSSTIAWDGKDGNGVDVPVGNVDTLLKSEISVSEVHFPAADFEGNPNGFTITRNGNVTEVFYDDSNVGAFAGPPADNDPLKNLNGENAAASPNGGHKWVGDGANDGRGNNVTLDTWARVLADSDQSALRITVTNVGDDPTGEVLLSGTVWFDDDGDRVVDPDEDKFSNCTVKLVDSNGTVQQTTTSDSNGDYEFRAWNDFVNGDSYDVQFDCGALGQGETVSGSNAGTTGTSTITGIQLFYGTEVTDQSLPLDPSGRFYDAVTRQPVAGVTVQLFANGALVPTACVAAGQQNQVTGTDGRYRFDIVNFGAGCPGATDYTIAFTVPTGFEQRTSTLIPVDTRTLDATNCTAGGSQIDPVAGDPCRVQTQETVPTGAQSTLYFLTFSLAAGDENVIHNHIPLDQVTATTATVQATFFATKDTSIIRTTRGARIPYTLTFTNTSGVAANNAVLQDTMPPGFKYVENTAAIDGVKVEPTVNGRELTWTGQTFAAQQTKTVEMVLVVGTGVSDGAYTNITFVESVAGVQLSNIAEATVIIIPDPLFDCTDIIGKVWDDQNGNAYQDKGEPGLPGVRLATVSGLRITTDYNGRYHIACADIPRRDRGSNFIVKLDTASLPSGYRMSTENPRVVRATRGKLIKANFGASLYRMVRLTVDQRAYDGVKLTGDWANKALPELLEKATGTERPAVIRIKYVNQPGEDRWTVDERIYQTVEAIKAIWSEKGRDYPLIIEVEAVPEQPLEEEVAK
ncbi:MAG: SdrD B-like domain-containing protein [Gammaproteobacteria bacterium]